MSKVEKHAEVCKALNALYARKNADYGDSFGKSYQEYGMVMACIRLEDKLNRLKSLTRQEAQVKDESVEDTLMDLANYSIMTLVERMGQEKPEPMKAVHSKSCAENHPGCICLKCAKDNDYCCIDHPGYGCPRDECPDFVPEREE